MPLGLVDLFRMVPPAPGSFLGACNEVFRIAFALSFLPIRCYMFPVRTLCVVSNSNTPGVPCAPPSGSPQELCSSDACSVRRLQRMLVVYLYPDLYAAYMASDVRNPIALCWFPFSGTALCALQLFWGSKILRILYRQATGTEGDRSKEA